MDKSLNTDRFLEVMGNYPTGVTVVTTTNDLKVPLGLTVNSFASRLIGSVISFMVHR